jgi:hypothetical protein
MKIGLLYGSYEDCIALLYTFSDNKFNLANNLDTFSFFHKNDEYIFSHKYEVIEQCDYKIRLFHTFHEWKNFKGFDKLIQTQTVENYHNTNDELLEYLDAGNICLSSASISFEHPNFYYEPILNLIFFYYNYGFNFLNYYKFDKKENLLGVYHASNNGVNQHKYHRDYLYSEVKNILQSDLVPYNSNDYNLKLLLQPYTLFGHWGNNHITSYVDFTTSVCNIIFETLHSNGNQENPNNKMHGRQYVTEKTLKAICFSEEEIFFIWYGPTKLFKHLINMGFWFLNCEFYNEETKIPNVVSYGDDAILAYSAIEQSVIDTSIFLKTLKDKLNDNNLVHSYLMGKYGEKLKNNTKIFKKLLNSYDKKENVLNLIKNGKGN